MEFLKENKRTAPPIYVTQFGLYLDSCGILRCKGRLNNAPLSNSSKNPIILPTKHHFTDLVVIDNHERTFHSGINITLSSLREKYWIIRGRETVKRVLHACVLCKKIEGVPYNREVYPTSLKREYPKILRSPIRGLTLLAHISSIYCEKRTALDHSD